MDEFNYSLRLKAEKVSGENLSMSTRRKHTGGAVRLDLWTILIVNDDVEANERPGIRTTVLVSPLLAVTCFGKGCGWADACGQIWTSGHTLALLESHSTKH